MKHFFLNFILYSSLLFCFIPLLFFIIHQLSIDSIEFIIYHFAFFDNKFHFEMYFLTVSCLYYIVYFIVLIFYFLTISCHYPNSQAYSRLVLIKLLHKNYIKLSTVVSKGTTAFSPLNYRTKGSSHLAASTNALNNFSTYYPQFLITYINHSTNNLEIISIETQIFGMLVRSLVFSIFIFPQIAIRKKGFHFFIFIDCIRKKIS